MITLGLYSAVSPNSVRVGQVGLRMLEIINRALLFTERKGVNKTTSNNGSCPLLTCYTYACDQGRKVGRREPSAHTTCSPVRVVMTHRPRLCRCSCCELAAVRHATVRN